MEIYDVSEFKFENNNNPLFLNTLQENNLDEELDVKYPFEIKKEILDEFNQRNVDLKNLKDVLKISDYFLVQNISFNIKLNEELTFFKKEIDEIYSPDKLNSFLQIFSYEVKFLSSKVTGNNVLAIYEGCGVNKILDENYNNGFVYHAKIYFSDSKWTYTLVKVDLTKEFKFLVSKLKSNIFNFINIKSLILPNLILLLIENKRLDYIKILYKRGLRYRKLLHLSVLFNYRECLEFLLSNKFNQDEDNDLDFFLIDDNRDYVYLEGLHTSDLVTFSEIFCDEETTDILKKYDLINDPEYFNILCQLKGSNAKEKCMHLFFLLDIKDRYKIDKNELVKYAIKHENEEYIYDISKYFNTSPKNLLIEDNKISDSIFMSILLKSNKLIFELRKFISSTSWNRYINYYHNIGDFEKITKILYTNYQNQKTMITKKWNGQIKNIFNLNKLNLDFLGSWDVNNVRDRYEDSVKKKIKTYRYKYLIFFNRYLKIFVIDNKLDMDLETIENIASDLINLNLKNEFIKFIKLTSYKKIKVHINYFKKYLEYFNSLEGLNLESNEDVKNYIYSFDTEFEKIIDLNFVE